jgi:thiol-disulfide isomerase/thioredoxin
MSLLPAILLGACLATSATAADRLSVGDPAPALSIEHFVKGERVDGFPAGKVTVVEFWATWCKPCIEGFPHLSELQEQYPDELLVLGVSDEDLATVEPFLAKEKWDAVTRYTVATDPDGSMQAEWMVAAGQQGIPCAFIVDRDGVVQYIGHPMAMDRTLERVITGQEPEAVEAPHMSPEERARLFEVEGTHSARALELLTDLAARLSAPGGRVTFAQELVLPGALRMGGPDGEAHDLRKTREGELLLGGPLGDRLDATRTMHLPGMPGGMGETESVLFDDERLLVKFASSSPFMPSPLPTDGWMQISRAEARTLGEESPMPLPMLVLMDISPAHASPLDVLGALAAMSALEVELDEDGAVVLAGPAAPMAGVPSMSGPSAEGETSGPEPSQLRIEFTRDPAGPVRVLVGDPAAPGLSMELVRTELEGEPDAARFDAGEDEPAQLLPILRERQAAVAGLGGPSRR